MLSIPSAVEANESSTYHVVLDPTEAARFAGHHVYVRQICYRGNVWTHNDSNRVLVTADRFHYAVTTDRCKRIRLGVKTVYGEVSGYELKFSRGGQEQSCGGQCVSTGQKTAVMTVPLARGECRASAPRCTGGLDLGAFTRNVETWIRGAFGNVRFDFANEPSYETRVEIRDDAVDPEHRSEAISLRAELFCSLGSPGRRKEETARAGQVVRVSPAHCNWPTAGVAMDLTVGGMPLMADGSDQPRRHFCITRYVPGRVVQGYRSAQRDRPCSEPDPLANRVRKQPAFQKPAAWDEPAMAALEALARRWAPRLYLHDQEAWMPSNIDDYLANSAMVARPESEELVHPFGALTRSTIGALPAEEQHYFLKPNLRAKQGGNGVCYAYPRWNFDGRVLDITYLFFYGYSGNLPGMTAAGASNLRIGNHDGDWERLTVRLSSDGSDLYGIYYAAHRAQDGVWQTGQVGDPARAILGGPRGAMEAHNPRSGYMLEGTHPVAFSARETHATYNRAATIASMFDETQRGRRSVACWDHLEVIVDPVQVRWDEVAERTVGPEVPGQSPETKRCPGDRGRCGIQMMVTKGEPSNRIIERSSWLGFQGFWGASYKREPGRTNEPASPKTPRQQSWWVVEVVPGPAESFPFSGVVSPSPTVGAPASPPVASAPGAPATFAGTYLAQHPHWSGTVTLNRDGRYARDTGDPGTWTCDGTTLVLRWDRWGPETLLLQPDGTFRAPSNGFTMRLDLAGTYDGRHPHWSDRVTLQADGTYARGNGDPGRWSFDGRRLTLAWQRWGPEILERHDDGTFRAPTNGFTLTPAAAEPPARLTPRLTPGPTRIAPLQPSPPQNPR